MSAEWITTTPITYVHYEIGEDGQVISKTITTHDGTDGREGAA